LSRYCHPPESDAARTPRSTNFDINLRTGRSTALITTNGENLGRFAIFTMVQTIDAPPAAATPVASAVTRPQGCR
jgi:hypothetical protein